MVVNNKPAEIPPVFVCGRYTREYSRQPLIMGIVNVTPDSFSDGGAFFRPSLDPQQAIAYALQLVGEGADILDIGGESTRPGSMPISPQQEMDRVLPVIEGLLEAGVPLRPGVEGAVGVRCDDVVVEVPFVYGYVVVWRCAAFSSALSQYLRRLV